MSLPYYADVSSKFPPILSLYPLYTLPRGNYSANNSANSAAEVCKYSYGFVWGFYGNMESKCDISGLAPVQKLISKARHLRDRLWDQL